MGSNDRNLNLALKLIGEVWDEMSQSPFMALSRGRTPAHLPDWGFDEAARLSGLGDDLLRRLDDVDPATLPGDLSLTLEVARHYATNWSRRKDWYWLIADVGFPALFLPTVYGGGFMLNSIKQLFASFAFKGLGDQDRYMALVHDYARLIAQMTERTRGQAERGILMPRAQLEVSVPLMRHMRDGATADLAVAPERVSDAEGAEFAARVGTAIDRTVLPAFDSLIALLENPSYVNRVTNAVGMGQYAGGAEIYQELVRFHTTLDLTAEQVHERGHVRMREILNAMRQLLDQQGFAGGPREYLKALKADVAWRARTPDEIAAFFDKYLDRIEPKINAMFRFKPRAEHGVKALPDALAGSMTFGYYSVPTCAQPKGFYLFNAVNLAEVSLPHIAALNYHELVPGHHFHLASQLENDELHPLRKHAHFTAFAEGWAEYAATLAEELGMYETPEEAFGRLMMNAFLTCRLVVDTGMNVLGWSLDQARAYMRENSFMSEREVDSETLRYSCGIPGQSLAYKLGDAFLLEQRARMEAALGDRFDIRDFHDLVLKPGGLPLPLIARNIDKAIS